MNILVIDPFPEPYLSELQAMPAELQYLPQAQRPEILSRLADCDILILNSKIQLDREAIDAAPNLKLVVRAGVGMDHIDQAYLREKGVTLKNTAGGNANSVGEQTVGMLLALRHRLMIADREVRHFIWRREANRGNEIGGQCIGLIGYGHTGQAVARRLSGFGMRVLAYDKYRQDYGDEFAAESSLAQIYGEADIVSFHLPLTEETRHWANDAFFQRLQKPVTLLNLARGPIVSLPALLRALDSGKVTQAALDVLPQERIDQLDPPTRKLYQALFARKEVIFSPHIGGWSHQSLDNINRMILGFVAETLAGQSAEEDALK